MTMMRNGIACQEVDLFTAVRIMQGRELVGRDGDWVRFSDGVEISCASRWTGPYSEVTPDIDADPPVFYIYNPNDQRKAGD